MGDERVRWLCSATRRARQRLLKDSLRPAGRDGVADEEPRLATREGDRVHAMVRVAVERTHIDKALASIPPEIRGVGELPGTSDPALTSTGSSCLCPLGTVNVTGGQWNSAAAQASRRVPSVESSSG